MKIAAARFLTVTLVVLSSLQLNGASLLFTFQDDLGDDLIGGFIPTGDISDGEIIINPDSGAYSVTLNAAGAGFNNSMLIEINLINTNVDRSGVATLSAEWYPDFSGNMSITFSSEDPGFENNPELVGWQENDYIQMSGSFNGLLYTSGTYSLDTTVAYDGLSDSGELIINPNDPDDAGETPDPGETPTEPADSDMDGVPDDIDLNIESDFNETVSINGVDTGVPNITDPDFLVLYDGLTLADVIAAMVASADASAPNQGQYVQELVRNFKMLEKDDLISKKDNSKLVRIIVQNRK